MKEVEELKVETRHKNKNEKIINKLYLQ